MRKNVNIVFTVICFVLISASFACAEEISLFDSTGKPIAYIDTNDELTIYLWGGQPVAYLELESNYYSIFGFNGKHLGWFEDGIIRNHKGYAVGFIEGAVNIMTSFEPYKGYKQYKPYKGFKQLAPLKPIYIDSWSKIPLSLFLSSGQT